MPKQLSYRQRFVNIYAPEIAPQIDVLAKYLGMSRSDMGRELYKRGISDLLSDLRLYDIEEVKQRVARGEGGGILPLSARS